MGTRLLQNCCLIVAQLNFISPHELHLFPRRLSQSESRSTLDRPCHPRTSRCRRRDQQLQPKVSSRHLSKAAPHGRPRLEPPHATSFEATSRSTLAALAGPSSAAPATEAGATAPTARDAPTLATTATAEGGSWREAGVAGIVFFD